VRVNCRIRTAAKVALFAIVIIVAVSAFTATFITKTATTTPTDGLIGRQLIVMEIRPNLI
jgi:hypothetical protein